nr:uncharacterized protein LOC111987206 [Quercus suber]
MQLEIDQLKRELHHAKRRRASPDSDISSDDERDTSYRQRSRTPPNESFSFEEKHHNERQFRSSPHRGVGNDAISRALNQISKSPFMHKIEGARLPQRFHQPTFSIYDGQIDPVEHVNHFNQRIVVHSKDEALTCKVFPSSLGPIMMRWFDGLKAESINFFHELTQAFGSRFVTFRRVPRSLASLLSLSMQEGENLKTYSDSYWEMFNEIEGDFDDVAISTFKLGLPAEHGLRKSLIGKPVTNVH